MKTIKNLKVEEKRVLVRCDFNVPLTLDGRVADDFRIKKTIPTIEYLLKKRAKIILMSHLGDPEGKRNESLSLKPVREKLSEYLKMPIGMIFDCIGAEVKDYISKMQPGEVLLLENLRFHKEEEEYLKKENQGFAKELAKLGDVYLNEAFSTSHRSHASIIGIPKYLPSAAGLLLEKEIKILSRVLEDPWRPLVVIIGGSKISTKIGVIEQFLKKADHLLLGGEIANVLLEGKGLIVGRPFLEPEIYKRIEKIDIASSKIHLPVDGLITLKSRQEDYFRIGGVGSVKREEAVFDIGPETIKIFSKIIKEAKMILWSGPLGMFEEKNFENGTKEIAKNVARNYSAFKIVGGGDTNFALSKFGLVDKFEHVSTGGGAMLEFLSGKKLPGIEALK